MLKKPAYTEYTLYLISDNKRNYATDYPIVFKTRDKEEMYSFIKKQYPNNKILPPFSKERKEFFNGQFKQHLELYITILYCHTFIETFSI